MRNLVLLAALLLAPLAAAQDHGHGAGNGMAAVLVDGPTDGRAVVGGLTHFGFALLGPEGALEVHRNAAFEVRQNGDLLFATTDSHEYDGLFSLDVVFHAPGPYEVAATSEGLAIGRFAGEAVLPADATNASIVWDAQPAGPGAVAATLSIVDEAGALVPHTDAIVELRDAEGKLVSRHHNHIHEAPIAFTHAFPAAGEYVARVTAYKAFATGRSTDVPAIAAEFPVSVPDAAPPAPKLAPPQAPSREPAGAVNQQGGHTLQASVDPQPLVGIGNPVRLAALITNDTGHPKAHVDFTFRLEGPQGLVFATDTLHEYDGMFEHLFVPNLPGTYTGILTAHLGNDTLEVPYRIDAAPPVLPTGAGPLTLTATGHENVHAGTPFDLQLAATTPAGPFAHSEFDVTLRREGQAPAYQFKLHTHGSGTAAATLALPEGDWLLEVDPTPLDPQPVLTTPLRIPLTVAAAPDGLVTAEAGAMDNAVPWAPPVLVALALFGAALLRR